MKTITGSKLIRIASIDSRAVAMLAVAAFSLLASCTTSRPVSYAGPESVNIVAGLPDAVAAAAEDREIESGHEVPAQMRCWRCDGVSWVRHNPTQHADHTCPFCSTINSL